MGPRGGERPSPGLPALKWIDKHPFLQQKTFDTHAFSQSLRPRAPQLRLTSSPAPSKCIKASLLLRSLQ